MREGIRKRRLKGKIKVFRALIEPSNYKIKDQCHLCSKSLKNGATSICKFCGKSVCPDCSPKQRENPLKQGDWAKICDKCETAYIKDLLVGEQKAETKKVAKTIKYYEENILALNKELNEQQASLQGIQQQVFNDQTEINDKLSEVIRKLEKSTNKVQPAMDLLNKINEERRDITQALLQIEEKQVVVIDQINEGLFEKSQMEKQELKLDQKSTELKDFLCIENSKTTANNLNKKNMDSVLVKNYQSSIRESGYNIFQDSPDTPLDSYLNFNNSKRSSLEINSNLVKGVSTTKKK